MADWGWRKEALGQKAMEVAESACLGAFEPQPLSSCYEDELRRARQAIARARSGRLVRFRHFVNRNAFLFACLDYTEDKREEHLLVGYGFRHGSTTKVTGLHHAIGDTHAVQTPAEVAHAMLDHYNRDNRNELLIFHNHPYNPLNFLLNNQPLASVADRRQLAARALNPDQLLRTALGLGRVLFYLGENMLVKQFRLPTFLAP
jgi:hypothetical protein